MTKLEKRQQDVKKENMDMRQNVERVDQDLEILERHAADVAEVESEILDSMKKWDREYKNARLHSVPRPLKHTR
jgi:DNA repair exonuclease SbcCD ATPase subunit